MFLRKIAKGLFYVVGCMTVIVLLLKIDDEFQESIFSVNDANSIGVEIVTVSDSELDYAVLKTLSTETENIVKISQTQNKNIKAWLNILGTKIDCPVFYSGDDFYLNHDEFDNVSNEGAIYVDKNTPLDSEIIVINGHNMKSGNRFAKLLAYKSKEYANEHCYIEWTTETGVSKFRIFATCIVSENYLGDLLDSQSNNLEHIVHMLQYDAEYYFECGETEQILVLNTCTYEFNSAHLIVCAYKI